ncbi:MAG TPA: zinc ribbon domain-containing protein, partial [Acidimicrobiia bacterium]|nr:zinc ribbon domain-containing protein [Acidimicrobiia bacterium]
MTVKERVAAVDGWFTLDDADPRLLGNRCTRCGSYFFPKASGLCRNPGCEGTDFEEAPLSNRGTVWSF